jgi:D-alanyl-D-alanine carboxypeptidase
VAVVIAEAIAGDEEKFARLMTQKARALGMSRTIYRNASGLPDLEQVTTAQDQVQLGRAIQDRFPRYYRYFSVASFSYRGAALRNHNHLLGRVEGMDGIKTGYTRASGFNLITSVHRGNRHVVAAVFGGPTARWRDARMESLLEKHIDDGATTRTAARILDTTQSIAAPLPRKRAVEPSSDTTATASAEARPSPGSFEPIRAVPVRTLTVRPNTRQGSGTFAVAGDSPFAPSQAANRPLTLFDAAPSPLEHPGAETMPRIASSYAPESPAPVAPAVSPTAPIALNARPIPHGGWLIQVGAFADESEAKQRLESVASGARTILGKADPFTERVAKDGKTFYRARFAGFDKDRAQAACSYLKRNDVACIALKN